MLEHIQSGPAHLDRTSDEYWEVDEGPRPTHRLDGHTMIYTGSPVQPKPLAYTWARQERIQLAMERVCVMAEAV